MRISTYSITIKHMEDTLNNKVKDEVEALIMHNYG